MTATTDVAAPRARPRRADLGVSLIVVYKLIKSAVQIAAGAALEIALRTGATERLHDFAERTIVHGTSRLALHVAHALGQLTTARHVHIIVMALCLDGVLSLVEGTALHRRYRWAPWLIVVATSVALPFEVVSLVHALRPIRLALLLLNVGLVVYLVRRARRERR